MTRRARNDWNKLKESVKATQVAFELEQKVARYIREIAAKEGLTPSDQIRKMIGLSYSPPKRPRLTVSLSEVDYIVLGEKYKLDPSDSLVIKRRMIEELIQLIEN